MTSGPAATLAMAALLAALPSSGQAGTADTQPLDLRLPPAATRPVAVPAPRRQPAMRLEPRKTLIERGVEGSREALIACQRGAYPGATVAASAVLTAGGEGQPDHCYRF